MNLSEFERLWPDRHALSEQVVQELEKARKTDRHCRQFAENGSAIRSLLQDLDEIEAPPNFSYRMRIYAENHKHEKARFSETSGFRWGSLGLGLATGATAFVLGLGYFNSGSVNQPGMPVASDTTVAAPVNNAGFAGTETLEAVDTDSTKKKEKTPAASPHWNPQTVSTEKNVE